MIRAWAIIPSAGTGVRFGGNVPKPLATLAGKPVVLWTLEAFEQAAGVEGVVLVGHKDLLKAYQGLITGAGLKKVRFVVEGGESRTQSVRNGLAVVPKEAGLVLVHDAARPLVSLRVIEEGIVLAGTSRTAVAAVAVKSTIKAADPRSLVVAETFDRALLWEVQTPQVFEHALLREAYAQDELATDDAALVEKLGVKVRLYQGDYRNIKVTTPEDLVVAEAFLRVEAENRSTNT